MYQKKYLLYLYCLYNSWFCFKNEQKKLSTKYKVKQVRAPRFINTELESDLESDVEADLDSDTTI